VLAVTLSDSIHRHVTAYLRACLAQTGGNITHAAKVAGLHRSNFYRLCERCEVSFTEARSAAPMPRATSTLFATWSLPRRITRPSGVSP
jgi:hypothetical protein